MDLSLRKVRYLFLAALIATALGGCTQNGSLADFGSGGPGNGSPYVSLGAIADTNVNLNTNPPIISIVDAGSASFSINVPPAVGTAEQVGQTRWRFRVNRSLIETTQGNIEIYMNGNLLETIPVNVFVTSVFNPRFADFFFPCVGNMVYMEFNNGIAQFQMPTQTSYTVNVVGGGVTFYENHNVQGIIHSVRFEPRAYSPPYSLAQDISPVTARIVVNSGPFQGQAFEKSITVKAPPGASPICAVGSQTYYVSAPPTSSVGQQVTVQLIETATGVPRSGLSSTLSVEFNGATVATGSNPSFPQYSFIPQSAGTYTIRITAAGTAYFGATTASASGGGGGGGGGGGELSIAINPPGPFDTGVWITFSVNPFDRNNPTRLTFEKAGVGNSPASFSCLQPIGADILCQLIDQVPGIFIIRATNPHGEGTAFLTSNGED